jgi:hypothetical protein
MSKFYRETEDFDENQLKGISMVVKATAKKFPFIKGWELAPNYKEFASTIYIHLTVDFDEVMKFYNLEWNPFWKKILDRDGVIESALITTFSSEYDVFSLGSEKSKEFLDKSYNETKKINDYLNNLYTSLPEEFKIKTRFELSYLSSEDKHTIDHETTLYVDRFVQKS